jgi:hypothetical protein
MVGETVNPDRNTHFCINDNPGSPREIVGPCKSNIVYSHSFAGLAGNNAGKN